VQRNLFIHVVPDEYFLPSPHLIPANLSLPVARSRHQLPFLKSTFPTISFSSPLFLSSSYPHLPLPASSAMFMSLQRESSPLPCITSTFDPFLIFRSDQTDVCGVWGSLRMRTPAVPFFLSAAHSPPPLSLRTRFSQAISLVLRAVSLPFL